MENTKEKKTHRAIYCAYQLYCHPPSGEYDIYPAFPLGKGKIGKGINQLADWIEKHSQLKIDGYIGVFWDELIIKLGRRTQKKRKECTILSYQCSNERSTDY